MLKLAVLSLPARCPDEPGPFKISHQLTDLSRHLSKNATKNVNLNPRISHALAVVPQPA
jgi:hypothetical protein